MDPQVQQNCTSANKREMEQQKQAKGEMRLPTSSASAAICIREAVPDHLSIDEILRQCVGEFGWAQLLQFTLASLAWTVEAMQSLVMIFADKTPKWQCRPGSSGSICTPESSICTMNPALWEWVGGASQSTVSEFGLVCGSAFKVGLVQSAFFVGCLLGAGVFGSLSDSFLGRKGALGMTCALSSISGLLTSLSPNYWIYLLLRTITGISCGGLGLTSFVLATEPVGPSKRGPVGMSTFYFYTLGILILDGLAALSSSWKNLYVITSLPSIGYFLLIIPFVFESPRWYLTQGRSNDALKVLKSMATRNGTTLPAELGLASEQENTEIIQQTELQTLPSSHQQQPKGSQKASGTLLDVFRNPATRSRMIIMVIVWFSCAMVYYGINLNVVNLSTSLYVSVLLNGLAEVPAYLITGALLERFGRRAMLRVVMLLSGGSCLLGAMVSVVLGRGSMGSKVRMVSGSGAIFAMAGTYNLLYVYTTELFPTVVRNAALGMASQAGQIGAVLAPIAVLLGRSHPFLPFAIFGFVSVLGGIVAFVLPETLHSPLFETFEGLLRAPADGHPLPAKHPHHPPPTHGFTSSRTPAVHIPHMWPSPRHTQI